MAHVACPMPENAHALQQLTVDGVTLLARRIPFLRKIHARRHSAGGVEAHVNVLHFHHGPNQ